MSLKDTAQSILVHVQDIVSAVEEMGGTYEGAKNLENTPAAIKTITGGGGGGDIPDTPSSISDIKLMLNAGKDLPIGTEIPDTWGGHSNPLIVGHNTTIGGKKAVGLLRKYAEGYGTVFNTTASNVNYVGSSIYNYLQGDYLNSCSNELKAIISETSVPYYNGSSMQQVSGKWFLFSAYEVCNQGKQGTQGYEGEMWEYWKNKTGLSNPDTTGNNSGRIVNNTSNQAQIWWLRSRYSANSVCIVFTAGAISASEASNETTMSVLPACYVIAD